MTGCVSAEVADACLCSSSMQRAVGKFFNGKLLSSQPPCPYPKPQVITWSSADLDAYLAEATQLVQDVDALLACVKNAVGQTQGILEQWCRDLMFERKEGRVAGIDELRSTMDDLIAARHAAVTGTHMLGAASSMHLTGLEWQAAAATTTCNCCGHNRRSPSCNISCRCCVHACRWRQGDCQAAGSIESHTQGQQDLHIMAQVSVTTVATWDTLWQPIHPHYPGKSLACALAPLHLALCMQFCGLCERHRGRWPCSSHRGITQPAAEPGEAALVACPNHVGFCGGCLQHYGLGGCGSCTHPVLLPLPHCCCRLT